jgi:hypothetical protein
MLFGKYIDLKYFIASLALGLFYIYISDEYRKVVVLYPTPENMQRYQYKDLTDACYSFQLNEVKCPSDENIVQSAGAQMFKAD